MPHCSGLYYFLHEAGRPSSPPVILLPGAGTDHLVWSPEIRRLPSFTIYALDMPGHGKSEGALSVLRFLDALGIWKAVFVGHSLGGAVALTMALDHPQRTAGLGLISCSARMTLPAGILENAASPSTFASAVQRLNELACSTQSSPRLVE
jgi:pimeloyl-ACP methyl ester carboxylesterase